jgi:hypothetical protein
MKPIQFPVYPSVVVIDPAFIHHWQRTGTS